MEAESGEELEPSVEAELPESDEVPELPDSPATPVPEEELVVLPVEETGMVTINPPSLVPEIS